MLNIDPVVTVNVAVGASSVSPGVFDVGAILTPTPGTGTPLTSTSRFAVYESLAEVGAGVESTKPAFATTTDVYKAASKFFGVSPAPARLIVIFYETDPDAEPYDSTAKYNVGDYCTNLTKLWRCTTAIAEGGETWNAEHWAEVTPTDETPTSAMLDAIEKGAEFYGVYYSPKSGETAANIKTNLVAITSALNSLNNGMLFYGVTGTATQIIANEGVMKTMALASAKRAIGIACTSEVDDACGLMGVAMGYAHTASDRAFALCYKSIATATANAFTQAEVQNIEEINGNVYVARTKTRAGLECGAVASGLRFDDVLYLDMIAHDIQNGIYSMIADSPTKLPQNDTTSTLFISEINRILEAYYNIGVLSEAVWRGTLYDGMDENMIIEHGYYAFARPFDEQTTADRAAHKSMPITVLLCLAGSVESIVINLDVQT